MYPKSRITNDPRRRTAFNPVREDRTRKFAKTITSALAALALIFTVVAPAQAEEPGDAHETGMVDAARTQAASAEVADPPPAEPEPEPEPEPAPAPVPAPEPEPQPLAAAPKPAPEPAPLADEPAALPVSPDEGAQPGDEPESDPRTVEEPAVPRSTPAPAAEESQPVLRWKAVDAAGALLAGHTFAVEGPSDALPSDNAGWATAFATEVADNIGQAGYEGDDLDPTPGVLMVELLSDASHTLEVEEDEPYRVRSDATVAGDENDDDATWQVLRGTLDTDSDAQGIAIPESETEGPAGSKDDDESAQEVPERSERDNRESSDDPTVGDPVPTDTDGTGDDIDLRRGAYLNSDRADFEVFNGIGILANPVTIPIPGIQAQMANHGGWTGENGSPTSSTNCVKYGINALSGGSIVTSGNASNTGGGGSNTAWVGATQTAWSAHGTQNADFWGNLICHTQNRVQLNDQSALGFNPSGLTSIQTGTVFNLGRMVHNNNPVYTSDNWFRGNMNIRFMGKDMTFNWRLHETPNNSNPTSNPNNNDLLDFLNQTTNETFVHNGITYTLVVHGFTKPNSGASGCTATLGGALPPINLFSTVEQTVTYGCLWASVEQVRPVTVKKMVESPYGAAPGQNFNFSSTSTLTGSPWAAPGNVSIGHNQSFTRSYNSGEAVTITEAAQSSPWEFTSVACVDGQQNPVTGVTYDGRTVTIPRGTATDTAAAVGITCTYTNTYVPKATLTLVKNVISTGQPSPVATPADWTLTAQGSGVVATEAVTGAGNSSDVTNQSVVAGTYTLSEDPNNATRTAGYVQDGNWTCTNGVNVNSDGQITLTHGKTTTCTVTNRYQIGELHIFKEYDQSVPGPTTGIDFTGTYTCSLGGAEILSGTWARTGEGQATLTPAGAAIPVGAECVATENTLPESSGLPAGYIWSDPVVTPAVTIAHTAPQRITVTNTAEQLLGTVMWMKTDPTGAFLEGSEWTLQGPGADGDTVAIVDCVESSDEQCTGHDSDSRAGHFSMTDLAWGTYTLTETSAPGGYVLDSTAYTFTISGAGLTGILEGTDGNVITNEPWDGLTVPLTGGLMSRDFYQYMGMSILILGAAAVAGALGLRHRRKEVA